MGKLIPIIVVSMSFLAFSSGCISSKADPAEVALAENFQGNPDIQGSYAVKGVRRYWNGSGFETLEGNLAHLLGAPEAIRTKADRVTFRTEISGSIIVTFFRTEAALWTYSFEDGKTCFRDARKTILIPARADSGTVSQKVELYAAVGSRGELQIVERDVSTILTGLGIQFVPLRFSNVSEFEFLPITQ